MNANPVLAEFTRGNWVENRYRGAFCISDAAGNIIASAGDTEREIFPRSAIKAIQALPIFATGALDKFALDDENLALACASHHGEPDHVRVAAQSLEKAGLDVTALECGAHPPTNKAARKALAEAGGKPTALHNNCSGKHAGMLAVAQAIGADPKGYAGREHEVQKRVRAAVEAVIGTALTESKCGIDGCSIPTWAAPLKSFATGFARMTTGEGLSPDMAKASVRLFDSATSHPFLVAGTDAFDTEAMKAFDGRLMVKLGAEGVFCGALRDKGLGFALKCDDGSLPAATAMIAGLLKAIAEPNPGQAEVLNRFSHQTFKNWRGIEVGFLSATDAVKISLR